MMEEIGGVPTQSAVKKWSLINRGYIRVVWIAGGASERVVILFMIGSR